MRRANLNKRQERGNGGLRFRNGKYEGNYRLRRSDGTVLIKSFRRDTIEEICEIKERLKKLGTLSSDVEKIYIDKYDNNNMVLEYCVKRYGLLDVKFDTNIKYDWIYKGF